MLNVHHRFDIGSTISGKALIRPAQGMRRQNDILHVEKLAMNRVTACPHEWDGRETKRALGLLERLLWRESNRYIEKVEAWNRRRGWRTPAAFLREMVASDD